MMEGSRRSSENIMLNKCHIVSTEVFTYIAPHGREFYSWRSYATLTIQARFSC